MNNIQLSNNKTILLVDDDVVVQKIHQSILLQQHLNTSIELLYDGPEVINYFDKNVKEADTYLMFLDINMPNMNAWELLDLLHQKELKINLIIIIVTSSVNIEDKQIATKYTCIKEFLIKPISKATFAEVVVRYLNSST